MDNQRKSCAEKRTIGFMRRLFADLLSRGISFSPAEVLKLIDNYDELLDGVESLIIGIARGQTRFCDEKTESSVNYPSTYRGARSLKDQITELSALLDLNPMGAMRLIPDLPALPVGAEGWFAIPTVEALSKRHFPTVTDEYDRYSHAVRFLVSRGLGRLGFAQCPPMTPTYLKPRQRTLSAIEEISSVQRTEILIIPATLGMRHKGKSARLTRESFSDHEFGLGVLATLSILLTHRDMTKDIGGMTLACAGDDYSELGRLTHFNSTIVFSDHGPQCLPNSHHNEYIATGSGFNLYSR